MNNHKISFRVPSTSNTSCIMEKDSQKYSLTFYKEGQQLSKIMITEEEINRESLRKVAINSGINDWYSLSGPYDVADEILRVWHRNYKKKSFLKRILGK
ncbi:hypothetical protein [Candidatus Hodarchaeum mangrovi]